MRSDNGYINIYTEVLDKHKINGRYIIDPNKKVKDPIKSQISTKNSQRLNKKEILDLILKK